MFNCKDSIDALLSYLDGDMSSEMSKELEEHLYRCGPCVDFLRTYKATPGMCRKALAAKMPKEVADQLTDFLRQKMKK
jgi:anti-sigma factor RsiW